MYSILISKNPTTKTYTYYEKKDETVFGCETLEDLGKKIKELLKSYTLDQIIPIKNCEFEDGISIIVKETGTAPDSSSSDTSTP